MVPLVRQFSLCRWRLSFPPSSVVRGGRFSPGTDLPGRLFRRLGIIQRCPLLSQGVVLCPGASFPFDFFMVRSSVSLSAASGSRAAAFPPAQSRCRLLKLDVSLLRECPGVASRDEWGGSLTSLRKYYWPSLPLSQAAAGLVVFSCMG